MLNHVDERIANVKKKNTHIQNTLITDHVY